MTSTLLCFLLSAPKNNLILFYIRGFFSSSTWRPPKLSSPQLLSFVSHSCLLSSRQSSMKKSEQFRIYSVLDYAQNNTQSRAETQWTTGELTQDSESEKLSSSPSSATIWSFGNLVTFLCLSFFIFKMRLITLVHFSWLPPKTVVRRYIRKHFG